MQGPGGGQYTKVAKKTGINRKTAQIAKVLTHQELKCRVLQWKQIRPFDGVKGALWLHYREELASKAQYMCPIVIVDLMHKDPTRHPVYQMRQTATAVDWVEQWRMTNASGSTQSGWDIKHQSVGFPVVTSATPDADKLHYGKASIALNLYGQKTRPVDFTVMLVKFNDEDVAPSNDFYTSNSNNLEHDIFWGEQLKTMIANPIARDNQTYQHKMTVLKSKKIHIEAAGTMDADNDPHVVTLNWSHGIHKTIDHVRRIINEDTAADLANEQLVNPNVVTLLEGPAVKDRVYLIIKANVYSMIPAATTNGAIDNTMCPSFDMNIHVSQYATKG